MHLKLLRLAAITICASVAVQAAGDDDAATRKLAETCAACHGPEGNSQNPAFPILAGQSWRYIYIELKDFNEGRRSDPVMSPMAANLSRDDMIALGNFFAAQKPLPIAFKADEARVLAGKKTSDVV